MRRAASEEACSTRARTSASCVTSDSNSSADDSPAPSTNMMYASTIAAMTSRPSPRRTGPCSIPDTAASTATSRSAPFWSTTAR